MRGCFICSRDDVRLQPFLRRREDHIGPQSEEQKRTIWEQQASSGLENPGMLPVQFYF